MDGWIKLHRQLLESEIFAHPTSLKIWVWCLIKANHKKRFVPLKIGKGTITVTLNVGEFIFGRFKAEDELNIDGSTIYKWIKKMEELGMISINSNNQYSIVSICNYAEYQQNDIDEIATKEQPKDNLITTKEQPSNTDKNVNNDNNVKKEKIYTDEEKLLFNQFNDWINTNTPRVNMLTNKFTIEKFLMLSKKYSFDEIKSVLLDMENFKDLSKKYTSAYLTANNWLKRNKK